MPPDRVAVQRPGTAPKHRHPVDQTLGFNEVEGVEHGAGAAVVQLPGHVPTGADGLDLKQVAVQRAQLT